MAVKRVIVCEVQVPFVHGGAEYHVRALHQQLRAHGYEAELVSIPFKWYPKEEILTHAAAWRLIDLSESNGDPIDLVIGTKFPSYFVRHPNKVAWLIHQYRAAYELAGTPYSDFSHSDEDVGLRQSLIDLDGKMLGECRRLFANARNTADRLKKFNGLDAEPLYHPPPFADRLGAGPYGDYVLFVGRLESIKRPELAVRAMQQVERPIRLIMVGDGTQRTRTEELAESLGVSDRIDFAGAVGEQALIDLYKGALAVVYSPFDEDYGYVTLEAFLAHKPVITTTDAGGPLEFVEDGTNGIVTDPAPEALTAAINRLAADRSYTARLGDAGFERARRVTWDGVIEKLVQSPESKVQSPESSVQGPESTVQRQESR
ncbi:MAG TPA: glycosyltransferase family 4 protein [Vicinamibacterales bacterium]|nr:glycosyltransferase family 4 protein [Vicinamibacterales bacterium]